MDMSTASTVDGRAFAISEAIATHIVDSTLTRLAAHHSRERSRSRSPPRKGTPPPLAGAPPPTLCANRNCKYVASASMQHCCCWKCFVSHHLLVAGMEPFRGGNDHGTPPHPHGTMNKKRRRKRRGTTGRIIYLYVFIFIHYKFIYVLIDL